MKTEDFERLKAVCEKEGFDIEAGSYYDVITVKKKDPWNGVEFFEASGSIHPILRIEGGKHRTVVISKHYGNTTETQWLIECCKPSTEAAYIEQLKKEFEDRGIRKFKIRNTDISMMDGGCLKDPLPEFIYRKDTDTLYFHGVPVYQQGKWATQAKERVEVKCIDYDYEQGNYYADKFALRFESKNLGERDYDKVGQFLASQLEKYLNGEVE